MLKLELIQTKWIRLFDRLSKLEGVNARLAAPFFSIPPQNVRSILYVGKATKGDWYKEEFSDQSSCKDAASRREERLECTKQFLKDHAPNYNSGFWHLARELDTAVAKKWNQRVAIPFQHVTWTNICKIGTVIGNPDNSIRNEQRSLAIETLRLEIELYQPQLLCFVSWDYGFDLVKEVIGVPSDESWHQTENKQWIWWRKATDKLPAVLLTGHPERKSIEIRHRWVEKALDLLPD